MVKTIETDETVDYLWLDGKTIPWDEATVHVNSIGHASVSTIYEGIKGYWNEEKNQLYLFRLDEHLRRFEHSLKIVRTPPPYTMSEIRESIFNLLQGNKIRQDIYICPLSYLGGIIRSFSGPQFDKPVKIMIDMWPFESRILSERTVKVCVSSWRRIADDVMPARVKCASNYHNGRLAAMEAQINGYDYPIILNKRGKVSEGPGACVFLVREGRVITPSVTSGILESITRASLIKIFKEILEIEVVEREVDRTEMYIADEAFLCGTGWEITSIESIDGLPVGKEVGEITKQIKQLYHDVVRGIDQRFSEWRTPLLTDKQQNT